MTISITADVTFRHGAQLYTSGQPYDVADSLAHLFMVRKWASGTPGAAKSVTMAAGGTGWREGTTHYLAGSAYTIDQPLADFLIEVGVATPLPANFTSVTLIDSAAPLPHTAANTPLVVNLHASGASEGTSGDHWQAEAPASLGGQDFFWRLKGDPTKPQDTLCPRDYVTGTSVPKIETWWFGWVHADDDSVRRAHAYTERKVLAMLDHVLDQYPHLSRTDISLAGTSMGAWGGATFGLRHPDKWGSVWLAMPRWFQTACQRIENLTPEAGAGLKMEDGVTDYLTRMDMKEYVAEPTNDLPFIVWAIGKLDNFSAWDAHQVPMIAALKEAKRGFVCAWGTFGHEDTTTWNLIDSQIGNTYSASQYPIGGSYPIFLNSSLDTDTSEAEGGINLGFAWRNLTESASGFSVDVSNVLGEVTVDVLPKSSVFTQSVTQQTVNIPGGEWVTVSWGS